jgi:hypothetical protein
MLGPPVCVPCRRIQDHIASNEEWLELRKIYPQISRWWCSKCKAIETGDHLLDLKDKELFRELVGDVDFREPPRKP